MQKRKSFPERQFLVYNAEIFFVNSYNPWSWVVKRTKLNSKKSVKWDTLVWNNENRRHLDIIVALRFYITRLPIVKRGTAWHHCCCPYQMWLANMQDSTTQSILSIQRCSNQTEGTTDILSCSSITHGTNNPFKKRWPQSFLSRALQSYSFKLYCFMYLCIYFWEMGN